MRILSRIALFHPKLRKVPESVGIAVLAAGAVCMLLVSWRKWPDPLIDAGHQLYTAWRLSEGAVLYRDVGCLYGPLSSYFNAFLFRLFGPGMMVLVWANVLVYAGIVVLAYHIFRGVYGARGAFAALFLFVWVFSFNQLLLVGNYTYALPYAHESTHGMLISLALLLVAGRWVDEGGKPWALSMGLLCGLALVLKPEFILLGLGVVAMATLLRLLRRRPPAATEIALGAAAALAPMTLFTIAFWRHLPLAEAFGAANQAWWTVLVSRVKAQVWGSFLGTDAPAHNLVLMLKASALLALALGVMGFGTRQLARGRRIAGLLVPLPVVLILTWVDFFEAAWCIPLALLVVLVIRTARAVRDPGTISPLGLLLAVAAFALLVRMFLHPRVYHFGFYQAALAAMVVVAEIGLVLRRAAGQHRVAALAVFASAGLALVAACLAIFLRSESIYSLRTYPVAGGRDGFFAFAPEREPTGFLVSQVLGELQGLPAEDKVLVVPEGLTINYLSRRQSPLAEWIFIDLTLAGSGETSIVGKLAAHPPEHVVLISRDLREHGIARFGAPGQPGSKLIEFFQRTYRPRRHWGGDPLDAKARGVLILDRAL